MIYSMTGYGGAKGEYEGISVSAELKSVNNRYLDVNVRLPKSCLFAEEAIRNAVAGHISRGKLDVFIGVDSSDADSVSIQVNEALAEAYIQAVRSIAEKYELKDELSALSVARFPEVMSARKENADRDAITQAILTVLEQALNDYDAMRQREGEKLSADILKKLENIESMVSVIEARSPQTVEEYRQKLMDKMKEILGDSGVEEARILQEAAIYADKISVDEETVRMGSHISQFRQLLSHGSPVGRKLDFLIQEMNREANTTGSKCSDSRIAKIVIDIKAEIEKIREQVQNIE